MATMTQQNSRHFDPLNEVSKPTVVSRHPYADLFTSTQSGNPYAGQIFADEEMILADLDRLSIRG